MHFSIRTMVVMSLLLIGHTASKAGLIERTVYVDFNDAELTCSNGPDACAGGWNTIQYLDLPFEPFVANDGDTARIDVLFSGDGFRLQFDPLNPTIFGQAWLNTTGQLQFGAKGGFGFGLFGPLLNIVSSGFDPFPGGLISLSGFKKGDVTWTLASELIDVAGFRIEFTDLESYFDSVNFPSVPGLPVEFGSLRLLFDPLVDIDCAQECNVIGEPTSISLLLAGLLPLLTFGRNYKRHV